MGSYRDRCSGSLLIRALVVLSTLAGPTCSQGNGASLSFERSQALLELLDNFGKAGLPNTEELAFHLCDLALPLTKAARHKAQLRTRHVAVGLLAYFYATPAATDLAYRAKISRHTCRPLAYASRRPRPLEDGHKE